MAQTQSSPADLKQVWPASDWWARLDRPSIEDARFLAALYGDFAEERARRIRDAVVAFFETYGNHPIRVYRAPGRINLRGMHVDTHGGWLNLMTHQRETVLVASPRADDLVSVTDRKGRPLQAAFRVRRADQPAQGWERYLRGSVLAARKRFPGKNLKGMNCLVAGDLPPGAGLSASAALCLGVIAAFLGCNDLRLEREELLLAVRDAEWAAGARTGLSDPGAILYGGPGTLVHAVLREADKTAVIDPRPFPDDISVLVVHSHLTRALNDRERIEYARNRFAYSVAFEVLRRELKGLGAPEEVVDDLDSLRVLTQKAVEAAADGLSVYEVLRLVPERISVDLLRKKYDSPLVEEAYERYFGELDKADRPKDLSLRGPLIFGMAESERAARFPDCLERGDYREAGRLMNLGHDGDRVRTSNNAEFHVDLSDPALERLEAENVPLYACPGAYRASRPALDAIVDAALGAGAYGASLTGAGLGGAVVALCAPDAVDRVSGAVRAFMGSDEYIDLAQLEESLDDDALEDAVLPNHPPAPAGEITVE